MAENTEPPPPPEAAPPAPEKKSALETISSLIQVVSVVAGVVISVLSFNQAREQEAKTRELEIKKYNDQRNDELRRQRIEAAKPFLDMRQKRYADAIQQAGILANPDTHTKAELDKAKQRFQELYWADLGLVEDSSVAGAMFDLSQKLGLNSEPTDAQRLSLDLAHKLRDSLLDSWGIGKEKVDSIKP